MGKTVFIGRKERDALRESGVLWFPLPDRPDAHYSDGEREYWLVDQDSYGPIVATIPDAPAPDLTAMIRRETREMLGDMLRRAIAEREGKQGED